jgi:uncharacterized protein (DUF2384 family)
MLTNQQTVCERAKTIQPPPIPKDQLGNLAYWHQRRLRWDPASETFIGDEEANQWLDRPKRGIWKV